MCVSDKCSLTSALSTKVILSNVALEPLPACMVTVEVNALPDWSRIILRLLAVVMKVDTPVITRLPLSDISPVVAVPLKVPPIVDAAKFNPASFTIVTAPVLLGARVNAPSTASWFRVIALALASVVAVRVHCTVTVELLVSVIVPPLRNVKLPSMVDVPMIKFVVPPSIVVCASLSLLVSFVVINN